MNLRVNDRPEMRGGMVFGPQTEQFEAGAGLGVVDDIEGFAFGVVFDA